MLAAQNISWHSQGRTVIERISFQLASGQMLALIGPNGSGKTTLLRCLSGYYRPSGGTVLLNNGQTANSLSAPARLLAYMPQKAPLLMSMSVEQAVMLGRRPYLRFTPGINDKRAVAAALACLELGPLASRPLHLISAGEYQRVLLARSLAQDTPILLLDEPLNNLDPAHQLKTLELLRGLAEERGRGIILSLHDLNLASRFCGNSLLLRQGKLLAQGTTREVLNRANLAAAYGLNMRIESSADGMLCFIPFLES